MAGTLTVSHSSVRYGVTKYTLAWTSTSGGAVSGNGFAVVAGELLQVKFVPGTGGSKPSDLHDITLIDTDSVDVLNGAGKKLNCNLSSYAIPTFGVTTTHRYFHDAAQNLDLVVANSGNVKTGTVYLWVGSLGS